MESIKNKIKNLPTTPGCYLFKDKKGGVIYVGKAKNLRNRVKTYWQKNDQLTAAKILMIEEIFDLDYVLVDSEKEALLLEANLIKKHKPKYNVILKDDKSFLYIKIDYSKTWPEIYWVRKPNLKDKQARFFGPYTSAMAARSTLETIKRIFPLCGKLPGRNTPESAGRQMWRVQTGRHENAPCPPDGRTRCVPTDRPCFRYQIGRCMGPCTGEVTPDEYKQIFPKIIQFLQGNWTDVIKDLNKEMRLASGNQQYEKAAKLRDQIYALQKTLEKQKVISTKKVDQDYVSMYRPTPLNPPFVRGEIITPSPYEGEGQGGVLACINLFKVRDGKLIDKQNFVLKNVDGKTGGEILEGFMDQYYAMNTDLPKETIIPDVGAYYIRPDTCLQMGVCNTPLHIAKRGKKLQLLKMGQKNAREYLEKQMASWQVKEQSIQEILNNLKKILNLPKVPKRIECYDISNIQGTHAVGSMVVFVGGEPDKGQYRKFKIKLDGQPNDVGMLCEILSRRFSDKIQKTVNKDQGGEIRNEKLEIRNTNKFHRGRTWALAPVLDSEQTHEWPIPDLIVVDGGKPQLNTIVRLFDELNIKNISICSLAKREEEIFVPNKKEPIILSRDSGELKLLQRLRDEAHRFGIGYYRKRHRQEGVKSVLDNIPGVGPATRKKLIKEFGSVEGVKRAGDEKLGEVVGERLAEIIRENL